MARGIAVAAEIIAEARRLYESGDISEVRISNLCGVSPSTLRRYADRDGWRRPDAALDRVGLVTSIRTRIDAEIEAAEAAMARDGAVERIVEFDKLSRSLASLVRTLRELGKYDDERGRRAAAGRLVEREAERADDAFGDLDALRDRLARRLESLRGEREA